MQLNRSDREEEFIPWVEEEDSDDEGADSGDAEEVLS
jgi:hypothetical protein